jgi:hypothetical protein
MDLTVQNWRCLCGDVMNRASTVAGNAICKAAPRTYHHHITNEKPINMITMKNILALLFSIIISHTLLGQKTEKLPIYFADPVIADSTSTVMIPVRYNSESLSVSKLGDMSGFYANIVFYDFKKDSSKKLFAEDTFIERLTMNTDSPSKYYRSSPHNDYCTNWIFYFVKTIDVNKNGKIDHEDPSVLFVSDRLGNNLKPITNSDENVASIEIFDKQGFALIKIQRDLNKDLSFNSKDNDFYYIRLDLNSLTLGNKIEIK